MKIGEIVRKQKEVSEYVQEEMFPGSFHDNYVVANHSYYINEDGKSVWCSSQITWRIKKDEL